MGLLKKIFGPNKDEVWQQLSNEIGGEFVKANVWGADKTKVRVQVREWTITLDSYTVSTGKSSVTYTRMRAPYVNKDQFRFTIYRKSLLSNLGKLFGMQDIEVGGPNFENLAPLFGVTSYLNREDIDCGYPQFDRDFIIKGNNEDKVKIIFKNLKIRELIEARSEERR